MTQVARCTNCRQWYTRSFTAAVEVYAGDHLRRVTVWCFSCIRETEQRSQALGRHALTSSEAQASESEASEDALVGAGTLDGFQQLVQEHFELMERAIHEDDAIVVPLIEDFMRRCHTHARHPHAPELTQRLMGHIQYWEAFLKALQQAL